MAELVGFLLTLVFLALIAVGAVVAVLVWSYNTLQRLSQAVRKSHSAIAVGVKTKVDLVRQLFEITKDYGAHEQFVHSVVARVEGQPSDGPAVPVGNVAGVFSQMARTYPDLKANKSYGRLMKQLEDVEGDIRSRRDMYNESAEQYNAQRDSLPTVLIASRMGFDEAPYFDGENDSVLELFKSDSGEMLRATLADFTSALGETSKWIGSGLAQRGRQIAEAGRTELDRTQDKVSNRRDGFDNPDSPAPNGNR